jgi:5-methylcytosine-specific restriction endonuclease McrA
LVRPLNPAFSGGARTDKVLRVSRTEVSVPVVDKAKASQPKAKAPAPVAGGEEPLAGRGGLIRAPVLVLNLNYVPINICTARRAIIMLGKGKAEQLENHRGQIFTVTAVFDVPSIIRLVYLIKRPFLPRKLSKKEVFLRDRFTCQYCGDKTRDLTLDHVIPRRQHGAHTWENVVAACPRCNLRKAGRTPVEAGMKLGKVPRAPAPNPYLILQGRSILEEWRPYLPWTIPV